MLSLRTLRFRAFFIVTTLLTLTVAGPACTGAGRPSSRNNRLDRYGDPLPPGAIARFGTVRLRQEGRLMSAVISPDGKFLATTSQGRESPALWELATGTKLRAWACPGEPGYPIAFTPDGKTLLATYSPTHQAPMLCLLDIATGNIRRVAGDTRRCSAAMSRDGRRIAWCGTDQTTHILDMSTLRDRTTIPGALYDALAFSPDGRILAWTDGVNGIRLWNIVAAKLEGRLLGHTAQIYWLAFAPDGKTLASRGADDTLRLWDVPAQKQARVVTKSPQIGRPAFSPDGKLLTDGAALWETATGKELRRWQTHGCYSAGFTPDGKSVFGVSRMFESAPQFWDVASGKEIQRFAGHHAALAWVSFSGNGQSLTTTDEAQELRRWNVRTGAVQVVTRCAVRAFARSALSPDRQVLATWEVDRADRGVRLLDANTGKELHLLGRHRWVSESGRAMAPWMPFAYAPDGKTVAWIDRSRVVLCEMSSGRVIRDFPAAQGDLYCVAFSPDGSILAVGNQASTSTSIVMWDARTGKTLQSLGHGEPSEFLRFSPDGSLLLSVSTGQRAQVWDVVSGKKCFDLAGSEAGAWSADFSPSGRFVALPSCDSKQGVRLWEITTNQEVERFTSAVGASCAAFSPQGRTLAAGYTDTTCLLWDLARRGNDVSLKATLTAPEQDALWLDPSRDAATAYRAMWKLVGAPGDAVSLMRRTCKKADPVDAESVQLIGSLDSRRFSEREKAEKALERMGGRSLGAVRRALAGRVSADARPRLERVLERLLQPLTDLEEIRGVRAAETLELIGTPAARNVLKDLAAGDSADRLTREARGSLDRLAQHGG